MKFLAPVMAIAAIVMSLASIKMNRDIRAAHERHRKHQAKEDAKWEAERTAREAEFDAWIRSIDSKD